MLQIRQKQIVAIRTDVWQSFTYDMVDRLRQHFPEDCELLGETQVRRVIGLGIERAIGRDICLAEDVCLYIIAMFILDSYFDEDPQLTWATAILEKSASPSVRIDHLYSELTNYLKRISGPRGEYYRRALVRTRRLALGVFIQPRDDDRGPSLLSWLNTLYQAKYRELHKNSLDRMLALGEVSAEKHGLSKPEGVFIYTALMFLLGSHFDRDPLHPWASATLGNCATPDPVERARNLYESAAARLDSYVTLNRAGGQ